MITGTKHSRKKRRSIAPIAPAPQEIESACQEIRSSWTESVKQHRTPARRVDIADARFQAHLRFIQILLAGR